MFLAILPLTTAGRLIARLRLLLFLASMWLPNARLRIIFPEPVILIRLAVPLWVLIFGILFSPYNYT